MAIEASADQVKYKCGCGKVVSTVQGWRGHRGFKLHPACADPYKVLVEGIGEPKAPPPAAQPTDSPKPQDDNQAEFPRPATAPQMQQAPEPDEPPDDDSLGDEGDSQEKGQEKSAPAWDPPQTAPSDRGEGYGALRPSLVPEKTVSYPVLARFTFDLFRAKYPAYKGSFNDFMFDMFDCALFTIGLHPVGIWTEPMGDPPPGAMRPAYDPEGVDEMMEQMAHAAA